MAQGLSAEVANFLLLAWLAGMRRQYGCYLKKWYFYCAVNKIDPVATSLNDVLEYLLNGYKAGLSYSTLGTFRSALSYN